MKYVIIFAEIKRGIQIELIFDQFTEMNWQNGWVTVKSLESLKICSFQTCLHLQGDQVPICICSFVIFFQPLTSVSNTLRVIIS